MHQESADNRRKGKPIHGKCFKDSGENGTFLPDTVNESSDSCSQSKKYNGTVCFTHFVYLSKQDGSNELITPMLLRYAYRRTAAIVVDDGRPGIDWLIPVRLPDDVFFALAGQDKNLYSDIPEHLVALSKDESPHKVTTEYFLKAKEKDVFQMHYKEKSVGPAGLEWSAILFAIGANDVFTGFAQEATRMALRPRWNKIEHVPYPCIVTTGLGYKKLMPDEGDRNKDLEELCNFVVDGPESYRKNAPITHKL